MVKQAINFMYGINLEEGITDYQGLFDIAEFLLMDDFKKEVDRYTMRRVRVTQGNLVEMCQLAEDWGADLLAARCASFIVVNPDIPLEEVAKMPVVMAATARIARKLEQVVWTKPKT